MYGVRVTRHELEIAFGVLVRGVSGDLVGESVTFAQSVDVMR